MNDTDDTYANLIRDVLLQGTPLTTRNASVRRLVCRTVIFDSTPLVSARKTAWKNALREMEWFLSGSSFIKDLHPAVRPWWQPWADKYGEIPFNYSWQFRRCQGYNDQADQIAYLLEGVKDHPHSRRNVISTWNTADMLDPECPITNCHGTVIQAFVDEGNRLDLVMYQRSVDVICGLPHNWIQYWALLLWLARHTGREVGCFHWVGGDIHVYDAHRGLAERIADAAPQTKVTPALCYASSGPDFKADDFRLDGAYEPVLLGRAEMIV